MGCQLSEISRGTSLQTRKFDGLFLQFLEVLPSDGLGVQCIRQFFHAVIVGFCVVGFCFFGRFRGFLFTVLFRLGGLRRLLFGLRFIVLGFLFPFLGRENALQFNLSELRRVVRVILLDLGVWNVVCLLLQCLGHLFRLGPHSGEGQRPLDFWIFFQTVLAEFALHQQK